MSLAESGEDELSEVARALNAMVAQLREAEFLERINTDLQRRSGELQRALSALRTAQAELVRAERMALVATLVRGIAHELNNPIVRGHHGALEIKSAPGEGTEIVVRLPAAADPASLAEVAAPASPTA